MTSARLNDKTLVMIVGPAGIGKSTIMHTATSLDSRFSYVQSFTTRPSRNGDASTYKHISKETATKIYEQGKAVTYFVHPTTGDIYGTDSQSYSTEFNLLDTLSGAVDTYRQLPFNKTATFSLATDPDAWQQWLFARYPSACVERTKRLQEAQQSIEWSLSQTNNHFWLINQPDNLQATAQQLISIVDGASEPSEVPPVAYDLLRRAKHLLSYD